jgi:hypothetical protein
VSVPSMPRCAGPVYLRVHDASKQDFDSVQVDGIEFGSLRVGADSSYKAAEKCEYDYGLMQVTSGTRRFAVFPIDFMGETPLSPGYYTHALTTVPSSDPTVPGGVNSKLSRDAAPK